MGAALRPISLMLVVIALMILGADVLTLIETSTYAPRSFIGVWQLVHTPSADSVEHWAVGLPGFAAAPVWAVLEAPAFVVIGLPGVLFGILAYGRR